MTTLKARMTKLVDDAIVFQMDKEAPSELALEDRIATLKNHKDIFQMQRLLSVVDFFGSALVIGCQLLIFIGILVGICFGWVPGLVFFVAAEVLCISALMKVNAYYEDWDTLNTALHWEAHRIDPMSVDYCKSLKTLISETPELLDYCNQVFQQGRKFTTGEYYMLCKVADELEKKKACNALYGIATE